MKILKRSFCLLLLALVVLVGAEPIFAASSTIYQEQLKTYNAQRNAFNENRSRYYRSRNDDDLSAAVSTAATVIAQRDQVLIDYLAWLQATIQEKLADSPASLNSFTTALADFTAQFQAHLSRVPQINNTLTWYSSDDDFRAIKQNFDVLAYQIFAALYTHDLRLQITTYQRLLDEQSEDILAHASSELARAGNQRELERLKALLPDLQREFTTLESGAVTVRSKPQYDNWKAQADAFLSQLIRNLRDFDNLWQN